jgi:hypothetical protein
VLRRKLALMLHAVKIQAEPSQRFEHAGHKLGTQALAIQILQTQNHLPALAAGIEPTKQRGQQRPGMSQACDRRRKAPYLYAACGAHCY